MSAVPPEQRLQRLSAVLGGVLKYTGKIALGVVIGVIGILVGGKGVQRDLIAIVDRLF